MANLQDLTGKIFTRLTVKCFLSNDKHRNKQWLCLCICGNFTVVTSHSLNIGKTKSCGCLQRELTSEITTKRNTKHGRSGTKEFWAWMNLLRRCYDITNKSYHRYGGRGITVCDRWIKSFDNFFEDMGEAPTKDHSIDRFPNNDGNYFKENCRWATAKQQIDNRSITVFEEIDGDKMCRVDFIKSIGTNSHRFYKYIKKGYTPQEIKLIFDNEVVRMPEIIDGRTMNKVGAAKFIGINISTLYDYYNKGFTSQEIKELFDKKRKMV